MYNYGDNGCLSIYEKIINSKNIIDKINLYAYDLNFNDFILKMEVSYTMVFRGYK